MNDNKKNMNWTKDPTIARVEELVSPSGRFKFIVKPDEGAPEDYAVYISYKDDWATNRYIRTFDSDMEKAKSFVENLIKEIKTME